LAGAFVAMGIGLVVSAWKWSWALRMHNLRYPYPFLLRTLCIGFFFNGFLPTAVGGDAYRVLRTLPHDGYRSRALSAVVVERAMGFLALIVLGGIGALRLAQQYPVARQYWYVLLVLAVLGISGFIALGGGWLHRIAYRWRHYGYSRTEARGRTTHELLKTELAGGVTQLESSLAHFGIWAGELRHTTHGGNTVVVEGRLTLMSQHNGRWLVLEVNLDITDRKAAEAARRAMERQLAELRALGDMRHEPEP
jgi:PAS domain S-box-containing protein